VLAGWKVNREVGKLAGLKVGMLKSLKLEPIEALTSTARQDEFWEVPPTPPFLHEFENKGGCKVGSRKCLKGERYFFQGSGRGEFQNGTGMECGG
jgi:hypothetical protein